MIIFYYTKPSSLKEKKILNTINECNSIIIIYFNLMFMFGLTISKIKYYILLYELNYQNINKLIYKYPKRYEQKIK